MIERPIVGEPQKYRGHIITVRRMVPDFLGYVGDVELSGFFLTPDAATQAGMRHVDAEIKADEEKRAKAAKDARRAS